MLKGVWKSYERVAALVRLDILQVPGPHCIAAKFTFLQRLQLYTLAPVAVIVLLCVPSLFVALRKGRQCKVYAATVQHLWSVLPRPHHWVPHSSAGTHTATRLQAHSNFVILQPPLDRSRTLRPPSHLINVRCWYRGAIV